MGFGLVFIGFMTVFAFRILPLEFIGYFIILIGLKKLSFHDVKFKKSFYMGIISFVYSLFYTIIWFLIVYGVIENQAIPQGFVIAERMIYYTIMFVFLLFLYSAVKSICKTVGYQKGIKLQRKSFSIAVISYTANMIYLTAGVFSIFIKNLNPYFEITFAITELVVLTFNLLWYIFTSVLIYSCYSHLVTQEMIQKEKKKIESFNKRFGRKQEDK